MEYPRSSPDGSWVTYTRSPESSVVVVPASGGAEQIIAEYGWDAVWSPDGATLVYLTYADSASHLAVVSIDTSGTAVSAGLPRLIELPGVPGRPEFSPAGDAILLSMSTSGDGEHGGLWRVAVDTGAVQPITPELPCPPTDTPGLRTGTGSLSW